MPQLIVTTNIPLVDQDGVDHRLRKEVDLWGNLTVAQQMTVTAVMGWQAHEGEIATIKHQIAALEAKLNRLEGVNA